MATKMAKVGRLEWGRYKEYLSVKFVTDFETWTSAEDLHLASVFTYLSKSLVIASVMAYLTAKIWLFQFKTIALGIIVYQVIFLANLASYETKYRHTLYRVIMSCIGCLVSQSLKEIAGVSYTVTAMWFLRLAFICFCYKIPTDGKRTVIYTINNIKGLFVPNFSRSSFTKIEESQETVSRLWTYAIGPIVALAGLLASEFIVSLVVSETLVSPLSPIACLEVIAGLSAFFFLNGQFITAKSDYYDKDPIWAMFEMIPETVMSVYYIPKSLTSSS